MSLQEQLSAFDGKHVAPLRTLADAAKLEQQRELAGEVSGPHETAATWILKSLAETGRLDPAVAASVIEELDALESWEAILHVLQMVHYTSADVKVDLKTLRGLMAHEKTLVCVWALDAFAKVGPPEEAKPLVQNALDAKQASMRARARKLAEMFEL